MFYVQNQLYNDLFECLETCFNRKMSSHARRQQQQNSHTNYIHNVGLYGQIRFEYLISRKRIINAYEQLRCSHFLTHTRANIDIIGNGKFVVRFFLPLSNSAAIQLLQLLCRILEVRKKRQAHTQSSLIALSK